MLRSLRVRNLAVLAGGDLEPGAGLNVLTGETGAGKSLVVDALTLLAGARAANDLIREGADQLSVAGVFDLPPGVADRLRDAGIEADESELVIRREVGREGRNRVFVNDQPATARLLQDLAPSLLRIHGQREELGLADPELQRAWLDRLGAGEAVRLLAETESSFDRYRRLSERLDRLTGDDRLRRERLDLLTFQAREIDAAQVVAGEEIELRATRDQLRHAEAITTALGAAFSRLSEQDESATATLGAARHDLERVAGWEPLAAELIPELAEAAARVEEAARAIAGRLSGFEDEPGRLDEVEDRLALLERLLRKYGQTTAEIVERRREIGHELAELDGGEERRQEIEVECGAALESYRQAARALSRARSGWAVELTRRVTAELADLALGQARVEVGLELQARRGSPVIVDGEGVEFGPSGYDRVVFRFAPNPGEPLLPLVRIASGGELARVALALQLASRGDEAEGGPTLVFDEIDAGLGGAQGAAVGRKLQRLARNGQIVAVTHLPQVASFADRQYRVSKEVRGGRTFAEVSRLDRRQRVAELARMLSGEKVVATSRRHAEMLLADAEPRG